MAEKAERMLKILQAMKACPCCEAPRFELEAGAPGIFEFTTEAAFDCGARVQLHPNGSSMLQAADGCPQALVSKLDELELESDEVDLHGDEDAA